jgi:hypothetical protein
VDGGNRVVALAAMSVAAVTQLGVMQKGEHSAINTKSFGTFFYCQEIHEKSI